VLTCGSVILAALMLKFGLPFLGALYDEVLLSLFFALFCLFCLSGTKDVKVFIAYSSILHITVFCVGLANFSAFLVEYFLIPHTLLSGLLF
jgi:NADH:ubiquinone oxidoreductase subunit 4 (subunit M)